MDENLTEFTNSIDGFYRLRPAQQIDFFAFYINVVLRKETFGAKEILACFNYCRIPPYSNIPSYLKANSSKPKNGTQAFIDRGGTYQLNKQRELEIAGKLNPVDGMLEVQKSLRSLLPRLSNSVENSFLAESIQTFEVGAYRAAIILVWLLTIDHLFEYVLSKKLNEFNAQLRAMNNKTTISSKDDFGLLKESVFIEVCKGAGIISGDVRKILDVKLGIRNSFAHPSAITLPKSKALEFIEDLVENVILKYA